MVNSMVERATSDMLIGPDWAMNIEICDMLNHDPGQAKDVVKGIKRRIGSRNSKVQLLALTLLETIIKNCGDIVHMHVAEKDVIHEMVKIVKKKPDIHVKEKILVLIDTWQEAFGGPRARYPQYYAAYQELLRAGAVFPQRSERAAPVFTPPQTQPLSSYPPNLQTPDTRQEAAEPSAESEFPSLSLSEIQNARGIMDVLSEMINAIDPENKEGLRQEVVIDLVEQCRTYKQRVVHLVNSTADESLLCQGLALNDDLQRLLAKHEAISSGKPIPEERPKDEAVRSLVDVDSPLVDTGATRKQPDGRSDSSADPLNQLLLTAPPPTTVKVDPKMDLLSGDDFSSPKAEASMALVPVGGHQPTNTPASDQTALVLFDMLSDTNAVDPQPGADLPGQNPSPLPPQQGQQSFQSSQGGFYANGAVPNMGGPQYEQSIYNTQGGGQAWNGQIAQPPQPTSPAYGAESGGSLPPPPWEALTSEAGPVSQYPQGMQANQGQMAGPVPQYPHAMQANQGQMSGPVSQYPRAMQANQGQMLGPGPQYPQAMQANQGQMAGPVSQYPQAMQTNQGQMGGPHYQPGSAPVGPNEQPGGMYMQAMGGQVGPSGYHQAQQQYTGMGMYPQQMYGQQQQMAGYGYGQYLDQRMYGLSVVDGNGMRNPYQASVASASSYVPPSRPSKPEDKLFGDLVDISKFKPVAK